MRTRARKPGWRDPEVLADQSFECGPEDAPAPNKALETRLLGALTAATAAREELTKAIQLRIARTRSHSALIEITGFTKKGGPLTKRISLADDGELLSDGSACVMSAGNAWRATFDGLLGF